MRYEIDELINGYIVVIQKSIQNYKKVFVETRIEALELIHNDLETQIKAEMILLQSNGGSK